MASKGHRRLRLPADHRSPAAARAAVREVLTETGLGGLLDEALLLTTELSTNGVIHAGTELDVEVNADEVGLTVTVTDFKGGPIDISSLRPPDQLSEHGRGLLLVDQFATAWGTTHNSHGKGVWFRLDLDTSTGAPASARRRTPQPIGRWLAFASEAGQSPAHSGSPTGDQPTPRSRPLTAVTARGLPESYEGTLVGAALAEADPAQAERITAAAASAAISDAERGPAPRPIGVRSPITPESCLWLVDVPDELRLRLSLPQLISELLLRLCEVTGAAGGVVWLDQGDGRGEQRLAGYGTATDASSELPKRPAVSVTLPVSRPASSTLALYGTAKREQKDLWRRLAPLSAERMAVTIESERLRQDDTRRRGWLTFLAEASELLAQSLDVELTLALVPQIVVPRLGGWCAVHVADEWGDLRLAASQHTDETSLSTIEKGFGREADPEVMARLKEALKNQGPVTLGRPLEGIAAPLTARGHLLGTLSVGRPPDRLHLADDVAVIEDVSRRASLAIDNSMIHAERKQIAQAFQRSLLPSALPKSDGVEFGSEYVPASTGTDVGGDFYDVLEVGPKQWLVAIGDICGKGAQAAALTGLVRDVMRVLVRDGRPLTRAVELLNRTLIDQQDDGRYCTLAAAKVSQKGQDLAVELCLAGHEKPLLLRRGEQARQVGANGTAVGLLDDIELKSTEVLLGPGDALVFFTDGVTERRRGSELYGLNRLRQELSPLAGHPAPVLAARIRSAVVGFSSDAPRDDIAILVLRNLE